MRILHLEMGRSMFGGAYQVAELLRGLPPEFENHLACARGAAIGREAAAFAEVHRLPWGGDTDLRGYFALRRLLRRARPELVHIHSRRGADFWGVLAARGASLPHIITRRVDNPEPRWLARWRYRDCLRVVGISARICEVLRTAGVPGERISLIRSGVDAERYQPATADGGLHRELGIPDGAPLIGMIAQFIPRKGHRELVAAAQPVIEAEPRTHFVLFGKGRLQPEIERLVDARGLRSSFRFPGFRDDLPRLLPQLDIVAHPAHAEGLGVALLQASACGLPVVAGRAGGIPEIVWHGETGFLVEPGDVPGLASRLLTLLRQPALRERLGLAGRRLVEKECSLERMVEQNAQLYRAVATGSGKDSCPMPA